MLIKDLLLRISVIQEKHEKMDGMFDLSPIFIGHLGVRDYSLSRVSVKSGKDQ